MKQTEKGKTEGEVNFLTKNANLSTKVQFLYYICTRIENLFVKFNTKPL